MFLIHLLPASFVAWVETQAKARVERMLGIADAQIAQAEAELRVRRTFVGHDATAGEIHANRIEHANGRNAKAAK